MTSSDLEIFVVTLPGLEPLLRAELVEKGFRKPTLAQGGVTIMGDWATVWRANLQIRGASKVLVRLASFKADHLSVLNRRARQIPWGDILRADLPVRVEVSCKKSRIYHSGAAQERIEQAIHDELGVPISRDGNIVIKARIVNDLCTVSIDTSGDGLHKRGHKEAVNKAPLRETLASLMLRQCGYNAKEPVVDPMCGSGTFVIEAAEIAARLNPGRSRHFAFEHLVSFDESAWTAMCETKPRHTPDVRFYGRDRDPGAVRMSIDNAERAGVSDLVHFEQTPVSDLVAPPGPAGLVIVNPPYGARLGNTQHLKPLYQAFGQVMRERFLGWRVGVVTNSKPLASAVNIEFTSTSPTISHGGLGVNVYLTDAIR